MSHLYPIATSAEDAVSPDNPAALTRAEAERLAEGRGIQALETEWLTVTLGKATEMRAAADAGQGHAFIQQYENEEGSPVLAITYWRIGEKIAAPSEDVPELKAPETAAEPDHTDDLYFRVGRTKRRGRYKKVDPRQMDLFNPVDPESTT